MTDTHIDESVAREEFDRFAKNLRLDLDVPRAEVGRQELQLNIDRFVHYVSTGRITVDEEGWATVSTEHPNHPAVRFGRRVNMVAWRASDRQKEGANVTKEHVLFGHVTNINLPQLTFEQHDWTVLKIVFDFFLE